MKSIMRSGALIVVTVLVALSVQRVMAASSLTRGSASLGAERIRVVAGGDRQTGGQTGVFVEIPGATLKLTVPSGQHGLLLARFSASDWCFGGSPKDACRLAMRLHGPGLPADGAETVGSEDFFDAVEGSGRDLEAHSEEGFVRGLGPGTYTLEASYLTDTGNTFHLHSWIMTAEFWRSS